MTNLEQFKADYPLELARVAALKPDEYLWQPGITADIIAQRMLAAIENKGIGAVSINSATFRALAKRYGIKNTYKAWAPWLAS